MKPCGTAAAYKRHLRRGETPCDPCRKAATAYRNQFPKSRPERAWKTRDDILDRMTLDGGWLTTAGLAAEAGRNVEVVGRTLRRLRDEGLVVSRAVVLAHTSQGTGYDSRTEWRVV